MSKLTDNEILEALKKGKTILIPGHLQVRELLNENQGVLYANLCGAGYWQPFQPVVKDLEETRWVIAPEIK